MQLCSESSQPQNFPIPFGQRIPKIAISPLKSDSYDFPQPFKVLCSTLLNGNLSNILFVGYRIISITPNPIPINKNIASAFKLMLKHIFRPRGHVKMTCIGLHVGKFYKKPLCIQEECMNHISLWFLEPFLLPSHFWTWTGSALVFLFYINQLIHLA